MKALYVSHLPVDLVALKASHPRNVTIVGAGVYMSEVFTALLRYSTYDRILLPQLSHRPPGDLLSSSLFAKNTDRVEFVSDYDLLTLRRYDHLVFMAAIPDLMTVARLRSASGCKRAPITGVIHSLNSSQQLSSILLQLLLPLHHYDAILCSSRAGQTALRNFITLIGNRLELCGWPRPIARFRTPVLPLGINVTEHTRIDSRALAAFLGVGSGPVLLYFGRLSATSKADLLPLLIAFKQVLSSRPGVTLILAGDDTHFEAATVLTTFAGSLGIDKEVRVVPNPTFETRRQLYSMADVFVSPADSIQETFGLTVLEAMAAGLPTVVSDWNGYKDLVVHGQTGLRISTTLPVYGPLFDDIRGSGHMLLPDLLAASTIVDVNELVSALSLLLDHPERRRAMGEAAQRRAAELFDWTVVIANYENLWQELATSAALDGPGTRDLALDITQFGYQDIFGHYSTALLTGGASVRLSAMGLTWSNGFECLSITTQPILWFRPTLFEQLVNRLRREVHLTVTDLLASAASDDMDCIVAMSHLCRLIKYGFVEILAGPEK